jgi:hypothetical protein
MVDSQSRQPAFVETREQPLRNLVGQIVARDIDIAERGPDSQQRHERCHPGVREERPRDVQAAQGVATPQAPSEVHYSVIAQWVAWQTNKTVRIRQVSSVTWIRMETVGIRIETIGMSWQGETVERLPPNGRSASQKRNEPPRSNEVSTSVSVAGRTGNAAEARLWLWLPARLAARRESVCESKSMRSELGTGGGTVPAAEDMPFAKPGDWVVGCGTVRSRGDLLTLWPVAIVVN